MFNDSNLLFFSKLCPHFIFPLGNTYLKSETDSSGGGSNGDIDDGTAPSDIRFFEFARNSLAELIVCCESVGGF